MLNFNTIDWKKIRKQQRLHGGYDQTIYTFDIETSSGFIPPGAMQAHAFDPKKTPKYYRTCEKVSLCYEWQFGIDDSYYYGRELKDFIFILEKLDKLPGIKTVWVHNLSFEACFLLNLFFPDKIFAKRAHKVIYEDIRSIRFRCSYMLTNLSLASWADSIGAPPKLPDYDYKKIRTPLTPLDAFELEYGQRDLEILYFGIKKMLQEYLFIEKIPLTQTGRIRRRVNQLFNNDAAYRYKMARLLPSSVNEYARWRMAFSGGNTHANWYYSGILMKGVSCVDIASSYPFVCCSDKLPMSPFLKARNPEKYINDDRYCILLEVELIEVRAKMHVDYISYSKIYDVEKKVDESGKLVDNIILENGKINYCRRARMMLTGVDYQIIREAYSGQINILSLWYSRAAYLDRRYIEFILDRYGEKTSLKGVEGKEDLYLNGKQVINGIYGDFVSALIYDDTILNEDGTFEEIPKTRAEIQQKLKQLKEKPWKLKSSYIWGVFITAYARRNHFEVLRFLDKKNHIIYYDTDSAYFIGSHKLDILKYNEEKRRKIDKVLSSMGIDPERSRPKDRHGVAHQMGQLELEKENLPEFKAIRAKCYAYRDHDGSLHTTISGVSKKYGSAALKGSLDNFKDGMTFSYDTCGKNISHYNIDQPPCLWIDEDGRCYESDYKFGLNLQPTEYKLDIGQDFFDTLEALGSLSCHFSELSIDRLARIEKEV